MLSKIKTYPEFFLTIVIAIISVIFALLSYPLLAQGIISIFAVIMALRLLYGMIQDLKSGKYGVDILAFVAILATIAVGEYWATIVIVLMMTGGEVLEEYASERAKRELTALMDRSPKMARLKDGAEIAVEKVKVGDILKILPGEVIPVDGKVTKGESELDESSLTGESEPVLKNVGQQLMSGSVNGESPLEMEATYLSKDSQYTQIVELVKAASDSRAPFVRLADKYAVPFTIIAFVIAGIAWYISKDPRRFAEVLVVATPCPLLIAAPVAMISGMSKAAKNGIIVKSGAVLEKISRVKSAAFDKTGTLTQNSLQVEHLQPSHGVQGRELLEIAATIASHSPHNTSRAILEYADDKIVKNAKVESFKETPGRGIIAKLNSKKIIAGRRTLLIDEGIEAAQIPDIKHTATHIALDGKYYGAIIFSDTVRPEAKSTLEQFKALGVENLVMVTGDNQGSATKIAKLVGITEVHAKCLPKDKVKIISHMQPRPVMMTGDGVNDAPVLAASDIGVAMGAKGATAASESADVVIMLDDLSKTADAVAISQHTIKIALESILIGIGISIILMLIAATGRIPAVVGAGLQELVDVVVILNALRANK